MGGNDYLYGLAVAPNGSFYGAGVRDIGGVSDFAAAQYQSNGLLGSGWPGGKAFVSWGPTSGAFAVDVRDDGQIAIAGCAGGGIRWAQYGPSSASAVTAGVLDLGGADECAYAVKFVGTNKLLVAGTQTWNGDRNLALARFETTPDATVDVGDPVATPGALRLRAPFPNPLVQRCAMAFDLPRSGPVRLSLHDVAGRLVRTIAEGTLAAGPHHFDWDRIDEHGRRVAAGVYFVRLEAGSERARAKVVVLD
jgi:hypothetical protein